MKDSSKNFSNQDTLYAHSNRQFYRPWKQYSTTVIMQSTIGSFLKPQGWIEWVPSVDPPATIFYGEYMNTGTGAGVEQRVKWAGYKPKNSRCISCANTMESTEHILRECLEASSIWNALFPNMLHNTRRLSFSYWLDLGIRGFGKDNRQPHRKILFAVATWWLSKWRNDKIFNGKAVETRQKIYWIHTQAAEINSAFTRGAGLAAPTSTRSWNLIKWTKPPPDWVKINVDGSFNPIINKAKCRGLARDEQGRWIRGFTHDIGLCTVEVAEASVCSKAFYWQSK
nr:pectinesterase 3-like [Ipomoea batatas]